MVLRQADTKNVKPIFGNKLDYIFGKATGNKHNIDRSLGMSSEMSKIGIIDTTQNRQYIMEKITQTYNDSNSIKSIEPRAYTKEGSTHKWDATIRETFIMGPYGKGVVIKTGWEGELLREVMVFSSKAPK